MDLVNKTYQRIEKNNWQGKSKNSELQHRNVSNNNELFHLKLINELTEK